MARTRLFSSRKRRHEASACTHTHTHVIRAPWPRSVVRHRRRWGAGLRRVPASARRFDVLCWDSACWWSDGERWQYCGTCLMAACSGGHLDVVKYLREVGGKELLMLTEHVSEPIMCLQRA